MTPNALAVMAIRSVLAIAAVGILINSLEYLYAAYTFGASGVYSWKVMRVRFAGVFGRRLEGLMDAAFKRLDVRAVLVVRMASTVVAVLSPIDSLAFGVAMWTLLSSSLVFNLRRVIGDDGSDQMLSIIVLTLTLCAGPQGTPLTHEVALWSLALQACLSYCAAGIAKLISPQWRGGDAIFKIFNTVTYGSEPVARFLSHTHRLNFFLCWTVMVVESAFPLCLVLPVPLALAFLAWGAVFHLGNAVIMGLNVFFWAFLATYPAILYVNSVVTRWIATG